MSSVIVEVLTALGALLVPVGVIVTAIYAYKAKTHAKEASKQSSQTNDAVNHTHGSGHPRLFDLTLANSKRIDVVLSELDVHASKLDDHIESEGKAIEAVHETIRSHIDWEVEKYLLLDTLRAPLEGEESPDVEDQK